MHPEDIPRRKVPRVFQWLQEQWLIGPLQLEPLLARLPLAERTIVLLGSLEGLDSVIWPAERDALLADWAKSRIPVEVLEKEPALLWDWQMAQKTALEGRFAYHVHRSLHPAAEGVGRLLEAAMRLDGLKPDEIVEKAMELCSLSPSGAPPNEVYGETRPPSPEEGRARSDNVYRVWPDIAMFLLGANDDLSRMACLDALEGAIAWRSMKPTDVLQEGLSSARKSLPQGAEIAALWVLPPYAYWLSTGERVQLLRARKGKLELLFSNREQANPIQELRVEEGDTFVVLDERAWAERAMEAALRRPEPAFSGSLRDALRRQFVERLSGSTPNTRMSHSLSPESLCTLKLTDLANALFAENPSEREATLGLFRIPPWAPPKDLEARIARELALFAKEEGAPLALHSASVAYRGDGFPPRGRTRDLMLVVGCDPAKSEGEANEIAERFLDGFSKRHPRLFAFQSVRVEPLRDARVDERTVERVRAIVEALLEGRHGLFSSIRATPGFSGATNVEVRIVRDDVDGASDESAAASELRAALREREPALLENVSILAEYTK